MNEFGSDYFRELGVVPAVVAACRECNGELGRRSLWWIEDRKAILAERYKKKYFSLLDLPRWTEHEIGELEGQLREYVRAMADLRGVLIRRLARLRGHDTDIGSGRCTCRYCRPDSAA